MMQSTQFENQELNPDNECLDANPAACDDKYSDVPEVGMGILPPLTKLESAFNWVMIKMPVIAAILLVLISIMITIDVCGRQFFNKPVRGITDLELLFMCIVGFSCLGYAIIQRQNLQIDLFYELCGERAKRFLYMFSVTVAMVVCLFMGTIAAWYGMEWTRSSGILFIAEKPFVCFTGIGIFVAGIAFFFQWLHIIKRMIVLHEYSRCVLALVLAAVLLSLPFWYKLYGVRISSLVIGGVGFAVLLGIMLLRVPLGWAMTGIGLIGILIVIRRPAAALASVATIPFSNTNNFLVIAFPMFMLMGEMVTLSGLSDDLFYVFERWLGRLPGGLACATVAGCAGFGAVCGDSQATVITMTTVALPAMDRNNYDHVISTGALAAGGTLGILIPPSMGFIVYSMITEESVAKLFVSGVVPGIVLATIFICIIILRCSRHPEMAPKGDFYPLVEKLRSLVLLLPVAALFIVVVLGILRGWFTPAEGGAIGSVMAGAFAVFRGRLSFTRFRETMYRTSGMFGKMYALFVGLFVLNSFLSASRLPVQLADFITGLEVNRWLVLTAIVILYIILGCIMNIMPMMMLTLPSLYPTVMALGFDGIWFGCLCVIVMEMGMITPPVGMNVFTLAGLRPDISTTEIFKGVIPFFLGMILCVILLCLFPQMALVFVS